MVCRLGVTKGVSGKGQHYDPIKYDLLTVFDVQKGEFRNICLDTLESFKAKGKEYAIRQGN